MKTNTLPHSAYFAIAVPFIISTVTQPLLGAVDTAVVGHLDSPVYIGGVAVGTVILNTLYWLLGFFRVSTTSQSSIALGRGDRAEMVASLVRPCILALCMGLFFICMQGPIWSGAEYLLGPEKEVAEQAHSYFNILIWGAPLVLLNYTTIGWLMGQAKVKATLVTQVTGNVVNILLDLLFVVGFGYGVAGVAVATLIAQCTTFGLGLYFVHKTQPMSASELMGACSISKKDLQTIVSANTDLLLRTVCLLTMFNLMTKMGASLGGTVLATNAVAMQVTFIASYIFDGIANASSVFAGKSVGEQNTPLLKLTFKRNAQWTVGGMVFLALAIAGMGEGVGAIFTDIPEILEQFASIHYWTVVFPIVSGFGLTLYGIFTGSGTTRPVRNSTFMALISYLVSIAIFVPLLDNTGLWLSFIIFYIGRGAFLIPYTRQVYAKIQDAPTA